MLYRWWELWITFNPLYPLFLPKKRERESMKVVNIYLTKQDKKKLDDLKWKYHVSYSTIANICVLCLAKYIGNREDYIYDEKGYKTSIKAKYEYEGLHVSQLYTNALKMYLNKEIKKYTNEQINQIVSSKIANMLNETWEENWNGNYFNRLMPKLLRKNKDYYKKVLGVD